MTHSEPKGGGTRILAEIIVGLVILGSTYIWDHSGEHARQAQKIDDRLAAIEQKQAEFEKQMALFLTEQQRNSIARDVTDSRLDHMDQELQENHELLQEHMGLKPRREH